MSRPVLGLFFALFAALSSSAGTAGWGQAEEETPHPPHQQWSFEGVFGTYDRAAAQRGFQVYKEVCAVCHPVKHLFYRDLEELGYSEDQIKGAAAQSPLTYRPHAQPQMFSLPTH